MSNYTRNYLDVSDEGKLTEDKDDHLVSCTLESNTLGMSPFSLKKFVITGGQRILQYVIEQLKKVPLKEQRGPQERECT
ncbi:protein unc-13 homolog [Solanum stenotomum]|uniref:protein unc-13 homolog n=1 Tax=Solanum stenotomum TaxID=172797 RepID=UPI0020D095B7|nr:protein unc-13 homolog [Solanum stenotomum]